MKIKTGTVINQLNGKPFMTEQKVALVNGQKELQGGRELTAGDVLADILSNEKHTQYSVLKAYALAQRFYKADVTDLDDSDYQSLREVVEENKNFLPIILAQVMQTLITAKEGVEKGKKA